MDAILKEANYLLQRWRFAASAVGFLWIQPAGPKLSPEELASFLTQLSRACGESNPRLILFDFSEIEIVGQQWTTIESMLGDFANSIGARCRVVSSPKRPISAFFLYQKDTDLGGMATAAQRLSA